MRSEYLKRARWPAGSFGPSYLQAWHRAGPSAWLKGEFPAHANPRGGKFPIAERGLRRKTDH